MYNSTDRELDSSVSSKAQGFLRSLLSFEFYFILTVIIEVFEQIEILNAELQKKELCVNESHASVHLLKDNIQQMRDEEKFNKIWSETTQAAKVHGIEIGEPVLKRLRNVPKRIDSGSQSHIFSSGQDYYKKTYYEIIDQALMSLNSRFENEIMKLLNNFENFVTDTGDINVQEIIQEIIL